jgi:plastocyanin
MKVIESLNGISRKTYWLTSLLLTACLWPAVAGDTASDGNTTAVHRIRIIDQYGRPAPSGQRDVGGQIFDVTVGPVGNEFTFDPNTINIGVGDTVRWTWASDSHSVTSGTSCTADAEFCSPNNTNCDAAVLSDTGFVYEFTFSQPGTYHYFCALHCFAGMTGVVNVLPAVRPSPSPRPRPSAVPRPQ